MTSNETDLIKSALIEFTDQMSVANALQSTGINLNGSLIRYFLNKNTNIHSDQLFLFSVLIIQIVES